MTLPHVSAGIALDRYHAAIYENQRVWVRRIGAIDAAGQPRAMFDRAGCVAVQTGATAAIMLPDGPVDLDSSLPAVLDWLRNTGSGDVLIWSASPHLDADRWLSAHGAMDSFVPRWMIRRVSPAGQHAPRSGITIRQSRNDDLPLLLGAPDIPYYSQWQVRATHRLATEVPSADDVVLLLGLTGERIVARAIMSIHDDTVGRTAGIYDVGVSPRWQRRGIGHDMMCALIDIAHERDADFLSLNATVAGGQLYQSLGFEDVGEGQTWHLPAATLRRPPNPDLVELAMKISGGEPLGEIEALAWQLLPNGDTPLAHAARFDQPETAQRLLELGTTSDLAALWQLGLRHEALARMQDRNALDARRGQQGTTPLHTAIYWGDLGFLDALLQAGADPSIRDTAFDSDAWGWCHALGNDDALEMLDEYFKHR